MAHRVLCVAAFTCLFGLHWCQEEEEGPVIATESGRIRGKLLRLENGKKVAAFLGVVFAEPPIGEMRFKPPVPKTPWNDTYDATSFGPLCLQSKNRTHWDIVTLADGRKELKRLDLRKYPQSEDCLNMNIYVPAQVLSTSNENRKPLSVMFFIHGGSYKTNGGRFYPGEWLASAGNVVVVTVNYRLGVLGFLSSEDSRAKGNYGLLDQVLALKWIKRNIENFGGNATDVTIFGNSAGGACVGLHLISPVSRGLFTKAIAQSGSPIGEWAVQRKPLLYAERLAKKLNCSDTTDMDAMLDCLRNVSAELIIEKSEDATLEDSLLLQFAPTVDGEFLLEHPNVLLQQEGTLSSAPVMVGVTRDELEDYLILAYQDKDPSSIPFTKDLLRKYLLHLVRKDFMSGIAVDVLLHAVYTEYVYKQGTTSSHHKKRRQQQKMTNGTAPYVENPTSALPDIRTLGKIISDIDLKAPSVKLVNLLALHRDVKVYMYEFDYASLDDVIINKYAGSKNTWVGSYHESELYYIFGFPHMKLQNALRLEQDKEVADFMIQLWTDFAKTGNPTPREDENVTSHNFTWRQFTEEEDCFATLGLQPFVARSYEAERMIFWNHFVPLFTEYPISVTAKRDPKTLGGFKCLTTERFILFIIVIVLLLSWIFKILYWCLCVKLKKKLIRDFRMPVL